jgi:hypothetical protein
LKKKFRRINNTKLLYQKDKRKTDWSSSFYFGEKTKRESEKRRVLSREQALSEKWSRIIVKILPEITLFIRIFSCISGEFFVNCYGKNGRKTYNICQGRNIGKEIVQEHQ